MNQPETVLNFWFGPIAQNGSTVEDHSHIWWKKQPETDALIKEKFEPLVLAVAAGEYNDWAESAAGRLALIITLDQFSRNIYRGNPQTYAYDSQAVQLCLDGLKARQDLVLPLIQRVFFYLPLEHAEDRKLQAESVRQFTQLRDAAPPELQETFENYLTYAIRHQEIVDRFGYFPHRNEILGRTSTEEEIAFLQQPGSSF